MSQIGIYRYKVSTLPEGQTTVTLIKNGTPSGIAIINMRRNCDGFILLKYLDSKGKYRFFNFSEIYEIKSNAKEIGQVNQFFESLLTDQGDKKSIGYTSNNIISAVAEHVNDDELIVLSDIYVSPRVYMKIGETDTQKDWLRVKVTGDNISRRKKLNNSKVNITIELPKNNHITMI